MNALMLDDLPALKAVASVTAIAFLKEKFRQVYESDDPEFASLLECEEWACAEIQTVGELPCFD